MKAIAKGIPASKSVMVYLDSTGGNVIGGLGLAAVVYQNDWTTMVGSGSKCASTCADIWLAGSMRFVVDGAMIGFHSAGREVGKGSRKRMVRGDEINMMRAAYYIKLGLSAETAIELLTPNPDSMLWLTPSKAKELGIKYEHVGLPRAAEKKDGCRSTTPGGTWAC
jgi:hypothetical protein